MVVFIGPVFFTLLKSTLKYGMAGGMTVAAGIFASDVLCVVLCSFGAIPFFKNPENQFWLAIGGSAILLGLGLKYLLKPVVNIESSDIPKAAHYTAFFAKGFVVNFVNPFVFLVWIGVIGFGRMEYGFTIDLILFLAAALLAILLTDMLKALFAHRLKAFISPEYLKNIYRVIGIALIGFGLRMIWYAAQSF